MQLMLPVANVRPLAVGRGALTPECLLSPLFPPPLQSKGLFSRVFGKSDSSQAKHEAALDDWNSMRETVRSQTEPSVTARDVLLRYFYQVSYAESRFPVGEAASIKVKFGWNNSFSPRSRYVTQYSLVYEKACVFFNAIAVETQLGCATERLTKDGIKRAAKHFCCAAGMLDYLKESVCCNLDDAERGADLNDEALDFLSQFMVAQAQMCTYEMGAKKPFPPKILAQIAFGARDAFRRAAATFDALSPAIQQGLVFKNDDLLSQAKNGGLRNTGAVLAAFFDAKGHYHQGCAELAVAQSDDVLEGFGAVIKRLHLAEEKCAGALALAKARATRVDDAALLAQLAALSAEIAAVCGPAERANSSVYFENVDGATLTAVEGKVLVKPEPYVMDSTVADPFRSIVPPIVHEVVAEFTSEVEAMFAEMRSTTDDAENMARMQLDSLGLPGSLQVRRAAASNRRADTPALERRSPPARLRDPLSRRRPRFASLRFASLRCLFSFVLSFFLLLSLLGFRRARRKPCRTRCGRRSPRSRARAARGRSTPRWRRRGRRSRRASRCSRSRRKPLTRRSGTTATSARRTRGAGSDSRARRRTSSSVTSTTASCAPWRRRRRRTRRPRSGCRRTARTSPSSLNRRRNSRR